MSCAPTANSPFPFNPDRLVLQRPAPQLTQADLVVPTLGLNERPSPLNLSNDPGDGKGDFVPASTHIRYKIEVGEGVEPCNLAFEKAGPRERIFFDPEWTTAAIVTCGGLCPGLNNVIRSVFVELCFNYGVKQVLGIRNGYLGLNATSGLEPVRLTPDYIEQIHKLGGTVLGSSRGPQEPTVVVDFLRRNHIDVLICVGGDGTQRGAHRIYEEITRRKLCISVVGVPKTIDNDIMYVHRTFGFATALEKAEEAIRAAHVEACGAINGIGLVKLMGRDAGYIAAGAALASQEVDFVLIPEISFPLEGPGGFLPSLAKRLESNGHAVVALAEGAGQNLFDEESSACDASGNVKHHDIGLFLKQKICEYFAERNTPINLKYFDPSYLIRSIPANSADRILSDQMARYAVHAAMAGNTDMLIGMCNNQFIHVPIPVAIAQPKTVELEGDLWTSVLLTTGQPRWR
jgi:6-phosphofructokinase 1